MIKDEQLSVDGVKTKISLLQKGYEGGDFSSLGITEKRILVNLILRLISAAEEQGKAFVRYHMKTAMGMEDDI